MIIRNFFLAMGLMGVSAFSGMALAQDTGGTGAAPAGQAAGERMGKRLSFLSADDREHFMRVREQVMASDPALKSEQDGLLSQWKDLKAKGTDATPEDKQALREKMRDLNEKVDAAMVKADPTVQPILDQIKAHRREQAGGAGAGNT